MRGDFSRIRRSVGTGYTAVLKQQGRVALDADANEQRFIDGRLRRTETIDVIGEFGGPAGDEGFEITVKDNGILIGAGRYYVDGLLAENATQVSCDAQPVPLPSSASSAATLLGTLPKQQGFLAVYLQVWQQFITALDDQCLREPALGTADTTAREQTVWRVVARPVTADLGSNPGPFCPSLYGTQPGPSSGSLTVTTSDTGGDCGCGPVAAAGYQGIENQLYRVEIHAGGPANAATFKWSRENGSVVAAVTGVSGAVLRVSSLGPDANLGFQVGQWVEVTDDSLRYGDPPNAAGTLYQVTAIDKDALTLTVSAPVTGIDVARNARVRRWDQSGPQASQGGIPLSAGTPAELENGISVTFGTGSYQVGDYWTFPARTATGSVEWPPCGSDGNPAQPPTSLVVHEAPLACLYWAPGLLRLTETEAAAAPEAAAPEAAPVQIPVIPLGHVAIEDCRRPFRPLTAAPAIHVQSISWANDDLRPLDVLVAHGLRVTFDQTIPGPVTGGNFIVTLETAEGPSLALSLMRSVIVLDGTVTLNGKTVNWLLPAEVVKTPLMQLFERQLSPRDGPTSYPRVRVRLPGEAFFATGALGPVYLDGRALGQPGTRATDGSQRIGLRTPSGDGAVYSDFESWFYLSPLLQAETLTLPDNGRFTGQLAADGSFLGVVPVGSPAGTTAVKEVNATVTLNYPAPLPAELSASVSVSGSVSGGVSGSPAPSASVFVTAPGTVPIGAGQSSATVPLTFSGTPVGKQLTASYTVKATVLAASEYFQSDEPAPQATLTLNPAPLPPPQVR